MPFTFAHPVAVLPFGIKKNKYMDYTALVIGSMAPDFEYFIHFKPYQVYGHTLLGQLFYNLPMVFIAYLVYDCIIKQPLICNLPKPFCNNCSYLLKTKLKINKVSQIIVIIYSALLGMFTHLLWDSFTHKEGYFVSKLGILTNSVKIMKHDIFLYKILQHGSSIIGILILTFCVLSKQKKNINNNFSVSTRSKLLYWMSIIGIGLIITFAVIILSKDFSMGRIVVSLISGGFIGLIVTSIFNKRLK